jgi:hypothetical protein
MKASSERDTGVAIVKRLGRARQQIHCTLTSMADASRLSPGGTAPQASRGTEFTEAHKESFRALAQSMSFVGVCLMLFGCLSGTLAVGALYSGYAISGLAIAATVAAALAGSYIAAAWWTAAAGRALSTLVRTRGRDLDHLMEAVGHLRKLFGFARALIIVQAALLASIGCAFAWWTFLKSPR